jgi:hypothetical protein
MDEKSTKKNVSKEQEEKQPFNQFYEDKDESLKLNSHVFILLI